jgi:predicted CoA-binding protein
MSKRERIEDFLGQKRLALVGVSRNGKDFTRVLFREFCQRGYDMVPVNPSLSEVEGRPCYRRMQDVTPPADGALLMTSPAVTEQVVRDCAEAGVGRVWMYRAAGQGAVSPRAIAFCEAKNIGVIPGECPFMFFRNAGFIHRAHGFIRQLTGTLPK